MHAKRTEKFGLLIIHEGHGQLSLMIHVYSCGIMPPKKCKLLFGQQTQSFGVSSTVPSVLSEQIYG